MAKLAAKKKPTKPDAPKKPTSRSKTGNAACSQAASNWQLSLRGKATLNPGTYQTLAKCRAMNRTAKMAEAQGRTGKLSAMGESAVKARLQARFDSGLITQKARTEKLDMLLKQRSQRGKVAPKAETPVAAKPASTAENKGTYGDYYFTPDGKYVSMSGSGGIGSNRVGARDINGKMIGWYDRKELRFANEKQRPTKESEIASERLSAISKEVSDLREKNARLLIGRDTTDKLRRELSQGKITKEKYGELVQKGYALSDKDYAKSGEVQKQIESVKSRLVQSGTPEQQRIADGTKRVGDTAPPQPEQPPKPKSSIAEGRKNKALDKQMGFNGVTMTRRKAVEMRVEAGAKIVMSPAGTRRLMNKDDSFYDESQISKTAMDYAEELIGKQPKPAQPARYSLGGKLAPGRGTEERKDVAYRLKYLRRKTDSHVLIAGKLHTGEWEETASGSGTWKRKAFDPVAERRSLLSRFNDITEYDKKRNKARTLTRKANKLAR